MDALARFNRGNEGIDEHHDKECKHRKDEDGKLVSQMIPLNAYQITSGSLGQSRKSETASTENCAESLQLLSEKTSPNDCAP